MPCFYPIRGWRARRTNVSVKTGENTGKRSIVFRKSEGFADQEVSVPCGTCIGCLLARASAWTVRATHESGLHLDNCFVTLTYDDWHIPEPPFLDLTHFQKFVKRVRQTVSRTNRQRIRYMGCGEYGERNKRPHYHILFFGWRPTDGQIITRPGDENPSYVSAQLSKLWGLGKAEFGTVTPGSAGYVARYTTKKMFENHVPGHEFLLSSRKPAIGIPWLSKYYGSIYPADKVVLAGKEYRPPIAYDRWLEKNKPDLWKEVHAKRQVNPQDLSEEERNLLDSLHAKHHEAATLGRIRGLNRKDM